LEGEIRFGKNLNFDQINEYRGFANRFENNKPKITLVLGAGNVSSIPVLDALFHMIAHKSVIYIKLNPVNDYLLPIFLQIFEPFISRGFMVVTEGDMEASKYLTEHDGFHQIHLTGSNYTYENIVYGRTLTDKERSLKTLPKINKKPITTELGNVTPIIIHPGNWTRSEIRHQAKKIVTAKLNNSGFNCIAAQVIVLPKNWKHSEKLKNEIKLYLKKVGDTTSYYPGASENLEDLIKSENYEQINNLSCSTPFLVSELDLEKEYGNKEVWSTALFFHELPYTSYENFCSKAIDYVNNDLWGNLGVSVLIKNYKKKTNQEIMNTYVEELNYGTVAINEWSALGFVIPTLPWGGFPGNKDNDIQSGQGYVHNAMLFESPQKGIIYSKFKLAPFIDPPWFVTNKRAHRIFKNLTYYQATKSKINLIKLIFSTLV
jgi:acyl-CoA reductase-like NAD-dependent aldehyde dehydrogenase